MRWASFTQSRPFSAFTQIMINWRRLDAWRAHPMLTHTMRASAPGFLGGAAAFALYVAYDKTVGAGAGGAGGRH